MSKLGIYSNYNYLYGMGCVSNRVLKWYTELLSMTL